MVSTSFDVTYLVTTHEPLTVGNASTGQPVVAQRRTTLDYNMLLAPESTCHPAKSMHIGGQHNTPLHRADSRRARFFSALVARERKKKP